MSYLNFETATPLMEIKTLPETLAEAEARVAKDPGESRVDLGTKSREFDALRP